MKADQSLMLEAAEAVTKRRTAFHGGAPSSERQDRFLLVLGAPKAVRISGGFMLCVGIDRDQAEALGEKLLAWAKGAP